MKNPHPGDLKQIVTIQSPVTRTDNAGNRITSFEDVVTVRAAKEDVSARDFFQADANQNTDVVTFTVRKRRELDPIEPGWRILHGSLSYDVIQIDHLGYAGGYLQIRTRMTKGVGT